MIDFYRKLNCVMFLVFYLQVLIEIQWVWSVTKEAQCAIGDGLGVTPKVWSKSMTSHFLTSTNVLVPWL